NLNGTLDLTDATLTPAALALDSLSLAGTLIAGQNLAVAGPFAWSGGTLQGVAGHGSLTADGGTAVTVTGRANLNLRGGFHYVNPADTTATWTDAEIDLYDGSIFDNQGTLDQQDDVVMGSVNSLSEFRNSG